MLSLTRSPVEEIVVIDTQTGERVVVTAVSCHGNQMKIGIEASERFRILRRELVEQTLLETGVRGYVASTME